MAAGSWTPSNVTLRHFFFQNNTSAMFSAPCCCLPHPKSLFVCKLSLVSSVSMLACAKCMFVSMYVCACTCLAQSLWTRFCAAYPVNMLDPIHIQSGSDQRLWPKMGQMILAHWLASGLDLFGQNLTHSARTKLDPDWFCTI